MRLILFFTAILFISSDLLFTNGLTLGDLNQVKQLNDKIDDAEYDRSNPLARLDQGTKNCFMKITGPSTFCILNAMTFWRIMPEQIDKLVNSKPACCAAWDINDCLMNNTESYCTEPGELDSYLNHIRKETAGRNARICPEVRSDSTVCKIEKTNRKLEKTESDTGFPLGELDVDKLEKVNSKMMICFKKVIGPSAECITKVMSYWQVTPTDLLVVNNTRPACCALWQVSDCMMNKTEQHCTDPTELSDYKAHIAKTNAMRNAGTCARIPSYSNTCSQGKLEHASKIKRKTYIFNRLAESETTDQNLPELNKDDLGQMLKQMIAVQHLNQSIINRIDKITINQMVIDLRSPDGHEEELEINLQPRFN